MRLTQRGANCRQLLILQTIIYGQFIWKCVPIYSFLWPSRFWHKAKSYIVENWTGIMIFRFYFRVVFVLTVKIGEIFLLLRAEKCEDLLWMDILLLNHPLTFWLQHNLMCLLQKKKNLKCRPMVVTCFGFVELFQFHNEEVTLCVDSALSSGLLSKRWREKKPHHRSFPYFFSFHWDMING